MNSKNRFLEPYSAFGSSDPILSCDDSAEFERSFLDSQTKVWAAMQTVGKRLGRGIAREFRFSRLKQSGLSLIGLIGKGHNGGDALLAIEELTFHFSFSEVVLAVACPLEELKPNTRQAFERAQDSLKGVALDVFCCRKGRERSWLEDIDAVLSIRSFDIALDGLLGMQFRAPLREPLRSMIERVNAALAIELRVAVDLPSGLGATSDSVAFQADVTFATGIVKGPLLSRKHEDAIGQIRYLDIGFFDKSIESRERVLTESVLDPLRKRRSAQVDKRTFGHLVVFAGSRNFPGALVMSVRSALQSGVGLVTVCAPESLVPQLVGLIPEAMWIPWPETSNGGLALEGLHLFKRIESKATAVLIGPGIGREHETGTTVVELLKEWAGPVVLDADALTEETIGWVKGPCVATPHLGEFRRMNPTNEYEDLDDELMEFARKRNLVVALKGPNTRIATRDHLYLNTTGNPILARGGSGDLLAGLAAGVLAIMPNQSGDAACIAVFWHGKAADLMATARGQVAVRTTDLLGYYSEALEESGDGEDSDQK